MSMVSLELPYQANRKETPDLSCNRWKYSLVNNIVLMLLILYVFCNGVKDVMAKDIPVGVYGIWACGDKNAAFSLLQQNGFTLASGVGSKDVLDKAYAHGVKCLVGIDVKLTKEIAADNSKWDAYLNNIRKQVLKLKDHPAVFAWYFLDEPSWHQIPVDKVKILNEFIKNLDHKTPIYTVLSTPGGWSDYLPYFDIVAVDPYLKTNKYGIESEPEIVVNWLKVLKSDVHRIKGKKPAIWVVLGAFEERERFPWYKSQFRKPSPKEYRQMLKYAMDQGVDGIMVWTLAFTKSIKYFDWNLPSDDPLLWDAVKSTPEIVKTIP